VFFGRLAGVPSDGIPYPIFTYTALVPWTFFSNGLQHAAQCLVGSANLLKKVYFPRLTIPFATILAGLVDFALAFSVLLAMMAFYGIAPPAAVVWVPLLALLALVAALGVGLWLAALNVQYRDVRYILPFLTQFWLFATPIAYSSTLLQEPWRTLYGLNPMVGVVDGFRWALLGAPAPSAALLTLSCASALVALVTGTLYFRRIERTFADIV
jgi:lipopolysaccharide transport system permease protein